MPNDYSKMTTDEFAAWLQHPTPPEDPDENAEFEEIVYFENGRRHSARRPNPKFKPTKSPSPAA
jgi:hypothetical protein